MKITSALLLSLVSIHLFACNQNSAIKTASHSTITANTDTMKLKITIGATVFMATLHNNATAFKAKLPMTIMMKELNGNEKYYDLSDNLPHNASNPGTIQTGDLMLYGSNTLVLFYKTFATSYGYTRLGRITDAEGLAAAVGSGSVTVTFELEEKHE